MDTLAITGLPTVAGGQAPDDFAERQRTRVIPVRRIDDEGERAHCRRRCSETCAAGRLHSPSRAAIARAGFALRFAPRNLECDAPAGTAGHQSHHQTRRVRGTAMIGGVDAKRAMEAIQARGQATDEAESRVPQQRPVAEDPQIACGQLSGESTQRLRRRRRSGRDSSILRALRASFPVTVELATARSGPLNDAPVHALAGSKRNQASRHQKARGREPSTAIR